jgi:hypothetical protein
MLVPTLLRKAPLYESLREHMLRGERFGVSKIEGVSSARLTPGVSLSHQRAVPSLKLASF